MNVTRWRWDWLVCYSASLVAVLLGMAFGRTFVQPPTDNQQPPGAFVDSFFRWDGAYYRAIAEHGYRFHSGKQSTVHFWPLYPLLGWWVHASTGLSVAWSLVLVANLCLAGALYLFARYADLRHPDGGTELRLLSLLAVCFVPVGFFFRMAYSESLFLLLVVGQLYLMERRASPFAVALVVGLATATRPAGLALFAPLLLYLTRAARERRSLLGRLALLLCLPLAASGFLGFLLYCQVAFGDPIACVRDRVALWAMRPLPTFEEKLWALETLEPVWSIFVPGAASYWGNYTTADRLVFSLYAANPVYFLAALGLLAVGWWWRWLNGLEILTVLGLLLLPYGAQAYEQHLVSMARYSSVAAPLYLVVGNLLARVPTAVRAGLLALAGFQMAAYAALFAQWHWLV